MADEQQKKTLGSMLDPSTLDGQMALLQMGQSMMAPQQVGTSFAQNAFGSVADGLNYLQRLEGTRMQQAAEAETRDAQNNLRGAQAHGINTEAALAPAELEVQQINALTNWLNSQTNEYQSRLALKTAQNEAAKLQDKNKQEIIKGVLDLYGNAVAAGQPVEPLQIMGAIDVISKDDGSSDFRFDPMTQKFYMMNPSIGIRGEDGTMTAEPIPVSAAVVSSYGRDPVTMQKDAQTKHDSTPTHAGFKGELTTGNGDFEEEAGPSDELRKKAKEVKDRLGADDKLPEDLDEAAAVLQQRVRKRAQELMKPPKSLSHAEAHSQAGKEVFGENTEQKQARKTSAKHPMNKASIQLKARQYMQPPHNLSSAQAFQRAEQEVLGDR